jgi:thioredoxin 1
VALELNNDNYENEVLRSKLPVVVDFWGPQCGPCLSLLPAVERLEQKYADKIRVTKLNVAAGNRMLCVKLRVLGLPSFLFYKDGVEIERLSGEQITEKDLEEAIEKIIA